MRSKAKGAWTVMALVLGVWGAGISQEHPEHPTSAKKEHEHPTGSKEHPKEHPNQAADDKSFQDDFEKVVKNYLRAEAKKTGGAYTIHDDVAKKNWKLELVKVHKNKICMLQEGKSSFACADLKEVNGANKLDLDFYATKSDDGKMSMEKVLIHKMNGKPRFTYDKENNVVPVK